jgi:hypothetical protein
VNRNVPEMLVERTKSVPTGDRIHLTHDLSQIIEVGKLIEKYNFINAGLQKAVEGLVFIFKDLYK